ncbi:hypothetical protein B0H10DRAFT_986702 [Mycena sp. CBHHK59/15]|nr:hypothetical protein B0H10DRAFT_986702 [Mycena sp. CBHHK59/15]
MLLTMNVLVGLLVLAATGASARASLCPILFAVLLKIDFNNLLLCAPDNAERLAACRLTSKILTNATIDADGHSVHYSVLLCLESNPYARALDHEVNRAQLDKRQTCTQCPCANSSNQCFCSNIPNQFQDSRAYEMYRARCAADSRSPSPHFRLQRLNPAVHYNPHHRRLYNSRKSNDKWSAFWDPELPHDQQRVLQCPRGFYPDLGVSRMWFCIFQRCWQHVQYLCA